MKQKLRIAVSLSAALASSTALGDTPILVSPSRWTPRIEGFYQLQAFGHSWDVLNGQVPWALTAPDRDTIRFESRGGDPPFAWDAKVKDPAHRTEIATYYETLPHGTPIHAAYGLTVEPGALNSALWLHLTQLHLNWKDDVPRGTYAGPVMSIDLGRQSEIMEINIGITDSSGKNVTRTLWHDTDALRRGHRYAIEWWAVVDPDGRGRLVVKRDGALLVNYSGPLGYAIEKNNYVKIGIYRNSNATETIASRVDHLKLQTGPDVQVPQQSLPVSVARYSSSRLRLSKVEGPFSDGTYRATVTAEAKPGEAVVFTRDRIPTPANTVFTDPSGSANYRSSISPNSDRHTIGALVDGRGVQPLTLTLRDGIVSTIMEP